MIYLVTHCDTLKNYVPAVFYDEVSASQYMRYRCALDIKDSHKEIYATVVENEGTLNNKREMNEWADTVIAYAVEHLPDVKVSNNMIQLLSLQETWQLFELSV